MWLSAAECAARTGLTVRALHVYEREGLLCPPRSQNGWRCYGPAEIARLNAITCLKELGLTLGQIRTVISADPPPLATLLQIQSELWRARRAAAERALTLLDQARDRLTSKPALSLEELCELFKGLEANRNPDMHSTHLLIREVLNESISAEEERALNTWWAQHPGDLAQVREHLTSVRPMFAELDRLAREEADPSSPEVQALVKRNSELLTLHGVRERTLRQLEWNPVVTLKVHAIGPRLTERKNDSADREGPPVLGARGARFLAAASAAWEVQQDLNELIRDAKKLMAAHVDAGSAVAANLTERLGEVCRLGGFGDPFVYIQWRRFQTRISLEEFTLGMDEDALAFLTRATAVRDGRKPVEMPPLPGSPAPAASDAQAQGKSASELSDVRMTPDEEYEWKSWWAQHPADLIQVLAYRGGQRALFVELDALASQEASPAAAEAQKLVERHNALLIQHGIRDLNLRTVDWNRSVVTKMIGRVAKARQQAPEGAHSSHPFGSPAAVSFLKAASNASPWGQVLAKIHRDAEGLIKSGLDPASAEVDSSVRQLRQVCCEHALGDAKVFARWAAFLAGVGHDHIEQVCGEQHTWEFLTRAIHAREGL